MASLWLAGSETVVDESAQGFTFVEQGSHAAICHDGREIIQFDKNITFFRGAWWALHQCMTPGGGPEVAIVPVFASYSGESAVADVRYEVEERADAFAVTIIPTRTYAGTAVFQQVQERCTFSVQLADGRYEWEQKLEIAFQSDVDVTSSWIGFYRFPHQDGRPGLFLQYADPQPVNASGPAVPMTRDWLFQPEPYVGPDSYRLNWRRRYVAVIFQDPDGSFAWSDLNKTKWGHLSQDNRRARPCHPQGLQYLLQEDGSALEYRCDAPSHYHHVCEWGMDFHYWMDVAPFLRGTIIPAGTTFTCTTAVRLVGAEVTAPVLQQAREITLTPREFAFADKPAYEEPENTFAVSALERLDAQVWYPQNEGCRWERSGGYREGTGCLVIHNDYGNIGSWEQASLGPSQWGNPFLAGARYRLSAWVKVENFETDANQPGPQVGVTLCQYNGPAASTPPQLIDCGWSASPFNMETPIVDHLDWTYIELTIPHCPSYVLNGVLKLRFIGRGTAYFSGVKWEMVEAE